MSKSSSALSLCTKTDNVEKHQYPKTKTTRNCQHNKNRDLEPACMFFMEFTQLLNGHRGERNRNWCGGGVRVKPQEDSAEKSAPNLSFDTCRPEYTRCHTYHGTRDTPPTYIRTQTHNHAHHPVHTHMPVKHAYRYRYRYRYLGQSNHLW